MSSDHYSYFQLFFTADQIVKKVLRSKAAVQATSEAAPAKKTAAPKKK